MHDHLFRIDVQRWEGGTLRSRENPSSRVVVPFRHVGLLPTVFTLGFVVVVGVFTIALDASGSLPAGSAIWVSVVLFPAIAFVISRRPQAWFKNGEFVVKSYFLTRRFDLHDWGLSVEHYAGAWFQWIEANWIGLYQVVAVSAQRKRSASLAATMTTRAGAELTVALSEEIAPSKEPPIS